MATAALTRYTPEEYLALERRAEFKSEYIDGRIVAMTGATEPHNTVAGNIYHQLRVRFHGRPCRAYIGDMKAKVADGRAYVYPDVMAICGEGQFGDGVRDSLINPSLIVEVLSPSTEAYDRGEKFAQYRTIDSLQEYVLVSQDAPRVERFTRDGSFWVLATYDDLEASVEFHSVGCLIPMREIYENVEFLAAPSRGAKP